MGVEGTAPISTRSAPTWFSLHHQPGQRLPALHVERVVPAGHAAVQVQELDHPLGAGHVVVPVRRRRELRQGLVPAEPVEVPHQRYLVRPMVGDARVRAVVRAQHLGPQFLAGLAGAAGPVEGQPVDHEAAAAGRRDGDAEAQAAQGVVPGDQVGHSRAGRLRHQREGVPPPLPGWRGQVDGAPTRPSVEWPARPCRCGSAGRAGRGSAGAGGVVWRQGDLDEQDRVRPGRFRQHVEVERVGMLPVCVQFQAWPATRRCPRRWRSAAGPSPGRRCVRAVDEVGGRRGQPALGGCSPGPPARPPAPPGRRSAPFGVSCAHPEVVVGPPDHVDVVAAGLVEVGGVAGDALAERGVDVHGHADRASTPYRRGRRRLGGGGEGDGNADPGDGETAGGDEQAAPVDPWLSLAHSAPDPCRRWRSLRWPGEAGNR